MKSATAMVLGTSLLVLAQSSSIYRCAEDGIVSYSDRPCRAGADPHQLDDSRVTVYTPPPALERSSAPAATKRPQASPSKSKPANDPAEQRARCARLEQGLRQLRSKMRSGYGVAEGERLRARQRQLKQQRRAQQCD